MVELFWKATKALARQRWTFAQESRLARFLGLSSLAHLVVAAAAPWLVLSFGLTSREERLLIREVDFVLPPETAPVGPRREVRGGGGGGNPGPKPGRAAERATLRRQASRSEPPPAVTPPPSPPTEARKPSRGDPAGEPVASPPAPEPSGPPIPDPRGVPARPLRAPATPVERGVTSSLAEVTALARQVATGTGLVATVALPRVLVDGAALDGGGRGGSGSGGGVGAGAGPGVGAGAGKATEPGAGLIDMQDPDFSEYFRVIEQRVRAAWKFPEGLQGTTQTVKVGFSLRLDGGLEHARVVSSTSGALDESALLAMRRASPFPPLPAKFRALAGQPLVISFTVTIQ